MSDDQLIVTATSAAAVEERADRVRPWAAFKIVEFRWFIVGHAGIRGLFPFLGIAGSS